MKRRGSPAKGPLSTRRELLRQTGKIILACALPALPGFKVTPARAAVGRRKPLRVGIMTPSHCGAPYLLARAHGFFRAEGLEVELRNYPSPGPIGEDLIAGRLDFGQLITPLVFALHTGVAPFKAATPVVVTQLTGTNGGALMIGSRSGIAGPADFAGKTIGVHSKLMVHYLLFMAFLESYGLDYRKDLKFKVFELDKLVNALREGKVDAIIMPEPSDAVIEYHDYGRLFLLTKNIWPNHPCCALVATRRYWEGNREQGLAFSRALALGTLAANEPDRRDELVDLLRDQAGFGYNRLPRSVLQRAFIPGRSDFQPFPYQSTALVIIEIMKKHGLLPATVDDRRLAGEVFLSGVCREVMRELGAEPPAEDYRPERILGRTRDYGV